MSRDQPQPTEALRRLASNRGLRLVKSRRRNPDAPDFGRYGLVDPRTGDKLFGFRRKRVYATAEEIEAYLSETAENSWKRSIRAR